MQSTLTHSAELRFCQADGVMGVIVIIRALRLAVSFVIVAWGRHSGPVYMSRKIQKFRTDKFDT